MPITFPNAEDPPNFPGQAVPDSTDLAAIVSATVQTGVISGCLVSPLGSPAMAVQVAAGQIVSSGNGQPVSAVASLAVTAAAATDRRDIIAVTAAGTVYYKAGIPCAVAHWQPIMGPNPPVKPSVNTIGDVLLAEIYVPAGATSITALNLYDKRPAVLIPGFFPGTTYLAGQNPANTKRTVFVLATGNASFSGGTNPATDYCNRMKFTLPATPIRCRIRIRNSNLWTSGGSTSPVKVTGVYWGTPSQLAIWDGTFTAVPTLVDPGSGAAADISTTEYVGPWFTPPVSAIAHEEQAISIGYTAPSGGVNTGPPGGYLWTGSGSSAAAGSQAAPGTTVYAGAAAMDARLEYEFVGSNQLGLFIGTSLTVGLLGGTSPYGAQGPDTAWPNQAGKRLGHCVMNTGEDGATVQFMFGSMQERFFTRFYDTSWIPGNAPLWAGGCVPDYACIHLPFNDTAQTLAYIQGRILSIVAMLKAAGIHKIIMCTELPSGTPVGQLKQAVPAGANAGMILQGYPYTPDSRPFGGMPGPSANWIGQVWIEYPDSGIMDGPFSVTAINGSTGVMSLFGAVMAYPHPVGATVMFYNEGIRQLYNQWVRSGVPGTTGVVDLASVAEQGSVPAFTNSPMFFTNNIHSSSPAGYAAMAERFASSFAGT
jgi:hypothetical protein